MLDVLVASRAPRSLLPRWVSGSLALHLLVFALAVEASRIEARPAGPTVADTTLLFLPRLAPAAVRPEPARLPGRGGGGGGGGLGTLVLTANPPPRGFQTVIAPGDIPTDIPPVDLAEAAMDPRNFTGWAATPSASSADSRSASWSGSSRPSPTWRCDAHLRSA